MAEIIKVRYSYDQLHELVKKIADEITESGIQIDIVIGIATGGWIPARILRTFLPHDGRFPKPLYSIGIINYDSEDNLLDDPTIVQDLPVNIGFQNKSVLLVDEVADSGGTFVKAKEYIEALFPKSLHTAVIHLKETSKFKPDFVGENAGTNWIVYPWDVK
ncbi:MAG: phosphoribosyltransferase family protein [Candidatus Cloacimonadota bacterium]|nr:phosphoribosyltransferase family protein [Candidatus Cloacimonadota bacterium]